MRGAPVLGRDLGEAGVGGEEDELLRRVPQRQTEQSLRAPPPPPASPPRTAPPHPPAPFACSRLSSSFRATTTRRSLRGEGGGVPRDGAKETAEGQTDATLQDQAEDRPVLHGNSKEEDDELSRAIRLPYLRTLVILLFEFLCSIKRPVFRFVSTADFLRHTRPSPDLQRQ